ncbi:MAG: TRAP transporter fused permease subunit [Desulfurococcaceae archaeon]|nr:TRAP transporter fused permease subunit [Desulfurococcaceae archaeon]
MRPAKYKRVFPLINTAFSTILILLLLCYVATFSIERPLFGIIAVGLSTVILSLNILGGEYRLPRRVPLGLWRAMWVLAIVMMTYVTAYFIREYPQLIYWRAGAPTLYDLVLGTITLALVILTTSVTLGYVIPLVAVTLILVALFGSYIPGVQSLTLLRLIDSTTTDLYRGVFGELPQIGATLVAVFLVLSGLMQSLGGFDFIFKALMPLTKRWKRSIVQVPVVASAFFGMFSGSGAANVAGTGSFTIPTMIKYNVPPKFAGAIEATASAGGQIMPPILGVAVFLMAEYLGVPYARIAYMAIVPALIFFASVGFATHFLAKRINIIPPKEVAEKSSTIGELVVEAIPFTTALISLIVLLGVAQLDAMLAGFYTIIVLVVVTITKGLLSVAYRKESLSSYLRNLAERIKKGLTDTARTVAEIVLLLACIQIIVVLLSATGIALKMSMSLTSLAYGNLPLLIVFTAIVAIILGCIVSTVAVYVLCYILVIPALLRAGIDPFIANFFVFWYAIAGLITPPVAGNVAVACRISKAGYFETAWEAIKIGSALFFVPALLIQHPELLHYNIMTPLTTLIALTSAYSFMKGLYDTFTGIGRTLANLLRGLHLVLSLLTFFSPISIWIKGLFAITIFVLLFYERILHKT